MKLLELQKIIKRLPFEYEQEVYDFIQFLVEKKTYQPKKKLKLSWRGALSDMRDKYTSVELQHKVLEWWGD